MLVRPGVAQTQAVLARELSGGSDEAARLFRQSVTLTRDIERARVELARLEASPAPTAATTARIAELTRLARRMAARSDRDPGAALAISALPQRLERHARARRPAAPAPPRRGLLQAARRRRRAYAVFATAAAARAFRLDPTPAQLDEAVDALRASITVVENDEQLTYPFDLETAHALYRSLFGPVAAELAGVRHLIFEPDGAMLRLPPNLLVMDRAGIDAYAARRAANPGR